jgi:hypothetical protein
MLTAERHEGTHSSPSSIGDSLLGQLMDCLVVCGLEVVGCGV